MLIGDLIRLVVNLIRLDVKFFKFVIYVAFGVNSAGFSVETFVFGVVADLVEGGVSYALRVLGVFSKFRDG